MKSDALTIRGKLSKTGLVLPNNLSFSEWEDVGKRLGTLDSCLQWWVGDWYNYGELGYGEKAAGARAIGDEAGSLTGESVRKYSAVASRYEFGIRIPNLTFKHHQVVAWEPDRDRWLKRAEKEGWTANELKRRVAEKKLLAKKEAQVAAADYAPILRLIPALDFLNALPAESADLLLTDPPYMTDVLNIREFSAEWVPIALSRLKTSARAFICCGAYPEELHAYLSVLLSQERFTVADVLVWTYRNTLGPTPSHAYKTNWQAVLHLFGPDAGPLDSPEMVEQFSVQDINAPDGRQGDRLHAWQKPDELAERFVRHASKPGDLIIDPFAGTGTFLLAASRLGRQSFGAEIDPDVYELAVASGCKDS